MNNERFTENSYEQALLELFQQMGYGAKYGQDINRELDQPFDLEVLYPSLVRINPYVPDTAIEEAVRIISNINDGT